MKRWFWLLILLALTFNTVFAKNNFNLSSITDNCHVVSRNTTVIPVTTIILNPGIISKTISEYKLGVIENISDYKYKIKNLQSDYIESVYIDTLRDSDNKSNVYYKVKDDVEVKKNDILMTFEIEIVFNGEYPSKLDILGNEVILSDKKSCTLINGYETDIITKEVPQYVEDNVNYIFFSIISILLLLATSTLLVSVILRRKMK